MPIKYPDFLQHNNPDEVLIDATGNQIKGFGFFANTDARDDLNANLRVSGFLAIVGTTAFIYTGSTWDDSSSWTEIGSGLDNVVEDATPQLGGDLDLYDGTNTHSIINSRGGADIQFTPTGTGKINLDGTIKFKRFDSTSPPSAFLGGMYADNNDCLYFAVDS
tara:strand:- start:11 stop:499 length:489 start_codon:yes stop_codon:yes gene_type:complete